MSMSGDDWAAAVFAVIPNTSKLSATEASNVKANLKQMYAANVAYLTGAVVVQPSTFAVPVGVAVATTGSPSAQTGATTAVGTVGGTGKIS